MENLREVANETYRRFLQYQKYMVMVQDTEYYGLLDRKGKRITLPDYTSIEPIAKNLYFCLPQGIIIDNQGKRVE